MSSRIDDYSTYFTREGERESNARYMDKYRTYMHPYLEPRRQELPILTPPLLYLERGVGVLNERHEVVLEPLSCLRSGLSGIGLTTVEVVTSAARVASAVRLTADPISLTPTRNS